MSEVKEMFINPKAVIEYYKNGLMPFSEAVKLYIVAKIKQNESFGKPYTQSYMTILNAFGMDNRKTYQSLRSIIKRCDYIELEMSAGTKERTGFSRVWKYENVNVSSHSDNSKCKRFVTPDVNVSSHSKQRFVTPEAENVNVSSHHKEILLDIDNNKDIIEEEVPKTTSSAYYNSSSKGGKKQLSVDEYIDRVLKKDMSIDKWINYSKKHLNFDIDLRKCDYSHTANGVDLWNSLTEHLLGRRIPLTEYSQDTDSSAFSKMRKRCSMSHLGVVKAMLIYIAYKTNMAKLTRDDLYISRMSEFIENITYRDNSYFSGGDYNSVLSQKECKEVL